jgi:hypothetical protein
MLLKTRPSGGDPAAGGRPLHRHALRARIDAFDLAQAQALDVTGTEGSPDRRRDRSSFAKE